MRDPLSCLIDHLSSGGEICLLDARGISQHSGTLPGKIDHSEINCFCFLFEKVGPLGAIENKHFLI